MTTVRQSQEVPATELELFTSARLSPVTEAPGVWAEDGQSVTFELATGPMSSYRRTVQLSPTDAGRILVAERTEFTMAFDVWSRLVALPTRRALLNVNRRQSTNGPVWSPPAQLDERAATVLGLLLTVALVCGYMGTVLTQTIALAAEEFERGTSAQGNVLAAVRIGVLGSMALVALADRHGRRRMLLWSTGLACVFTAFGALSPNIEVLGFTQMLSRGFGTAATLLLAVIAAEEMPAGSRAYAIAVMTMTGALGAGLAVFLLSQAERAPSAWRVLFVVALLGIPILIRVSKTLPESLRFIRPHRDATVVRGHFRRLWAIGLALFCSSAFGAPSSQLLNDFLLNERGFSAARVSWFVLLTSTPAGLALVAGGRLADTRGRRWIVAIGISGGAILAAWGFTLHGWPMWVANLAATILAALAIPAMGAYGPELFPTAARGKANGLLQVVSVTGSALGLIIAGELTDRSGHLSTAMFALLPLGLAVAVLALTVFPETARRELEDINPEDAMAPIA